MCGIAGVFLRDPALDVDLNAMLSTLLDQIEHRGGDATGFVAIGDDGVLEWQKAACGALDFNTYRREVPSGTRALLAHTRWATQGLPAFMENNHPLRRGAFFLIHNGHVMNDLAMLRACGKRPNAQVDSEAIVAQLSKSGSLAGLPDVMSEIHGMAAVAAVDERRGDCLSIARGYSSPLYVLETKRIVIFGSTPETVLNAYRKHIGSMDKNRVQPMLEGTCVHYEGRERHEVRFKPYLPVVVVAPPVKAITSKSTVKTSWDDKWDEDYIDCDDCGMWLPWSQISYTEDPTTGLTIAQCPDCEMYDLDAEGSEDFSFVNRETLRRLHDGDKRYNHIPY